MLTHSIAPDIFRKRLLIEGYFSYTITADILKEYFIDIVQHLDLTTYSHPIIHETSGKGKEANQGFDGFVPLIDSGIYVAVWSNQKFLSAIIYTCKDFDEDKALTLTKSFFDMYKVEHKLF
jgi:hypothetical protein